MRRRYDYPLAKVGVVSSNLIARSNFSQEKTLLSKDLSATQRYTCDENIEHVRRKQLMNERCSHGSPTGTGTISRIHGAFASCVEHGY